MELLGFPVCLWARSPSSSGIFLLIFLAVEISTSLFGEISR